MSRLVVVSNRVADIEAGIQSGGLAVALGAALKETGGLWFGWDGNIVEDEAAGEPSVVHQDSVTLVTVPLTRGEYDTYYLGYSNKVLWPSFHYRLDLSAYESAFIDGYRGGNARMADRLAGLFLADDIVWVHD